MNITPFPILQSSRLVLRPIEANDAKALFDYFSKDEVTEFYDLPTFTTIGEATALIENWQERYSKGENIRWAITLKDTPGELMGTCGFHNFAKEHRRAEIGYELNPKYWRQGIMFEALTILLAFGFNELDLHRIEAFIDPENIASRYLLEKSGLNSEGVLHGYFYEKGRFVDAEIYALLRYHYEAGKGQ